MKDFIYVNGIACEGWVEVDIHPVWVSDFEQTPGRASWSAEVDGWFPPGEHVAVRTEHGHGTACVARSKMGTAEEASVLVGLEPFQAAPR